MTKRQESQHAWYLKNKEHVQATQKMYRENNKEKVNALSREYRKNNKELCKEAVNKWKQTHSNYHKEYYETKIKPKTQKGMLKDKLTKVKECVLENELYIPNYVVKEIIKIIEED